MKLAQAKPHNIHETLQTLRVNTVSTMVPAVEESDITLHHSFVETSENARDYENNITHQDSVDPAS